MTRKKLRYGLVVIAVVVTVLILFSPEDPVSVPLSEELSSTTKGARILGIDITMAQDNDYDAAFSIAKDIGVQEVGLFFNWDSIETSPRKYDNPNFAIANTYYPAHNTMVSLTITPIHTNRLVVPDDLQHTNLDDPEMISRFTSMLDWVFTQIPDLDLHSLVIGSEFDVYFGTDKPQWVEYETFFKEVKAHIKKINPDIIVTAEVTFNGLTGDAKEYAQSLNKYTDVIGVSYYPLNKDYTVKAPSVVHSDFDTLTTVYKGRIIYFYQLGYPSSTSLTSSQEKQKQFIKEVFKAWDQHASQIRLIDFTWLHDIPPEGVMECTQFYGVSDYRFQEFLATLGLRTYNGKDKEALRALREEAKKRGW